MPIFFLILLCQVFFQSVRMGKDKKEKAPASPEGSGAMPYYAALKSLWRASPIFPKSPFSGSGSASLLIGGVEAALIA